MPKYMVLVIDDDLFSRNLLAAVLEENGYTAEAVEDGNHGLEIMLEKEVDLVLLDLIMPHMDGFEVLRRMKSKKTLMHIPVIVMSGEMDPASIIQCMEIGAVDYLTKPCHPELLNTCIKNVLQGDPCGEKAVHAKNRKNGSPGMMLVVDDDAMYRTLLTVSLEERGYIVDQAENGKQAWDMICSTAYDLVFLDLVMPEMNGFEVLEHIKSDSKTDHIPVIVVSAEDDMDSIVRCIENGAADYLSKPFEPAILHARVNASLAGKRQYDQEHAYFENIRRERRRSEKLLLNIMPKPIINRLKQGEKIIADYFEDVTVMFADIAGFTRMSGRVSPLELVNMLNTVFSMFDKAADHYGLEKIKTIGDAYMVVGGLPVPRADHIEAVADMALEIQKNMSQMNSDNENGDNENLLGIRIGIHTGPVIAGIIGTNKFSYDLWGDTVNIASRMESHGIISSIHVSSLVHERLNGRYMFEKRGVINVKGKGDMETWLLTGQK